MPSGALRPFFLLAAAWAALAVPVWLAAYVHGYTLRGPLPALKLSVLPLRIMQRSADLTSVKR